MMQKEKANINLAEARSIGAQHRAQQRRKMAASLLGNIVDIALTQGHIIMSSARTRSLHRLTANLQVTFCRQPLQLIVNGWLLDEISQEVMVRLDDFPNLLPVHRLFQQQAEQHDLFVHAHSFKSALTYCSSGKKIRQETGTIDTGLVNYAHTSRLRRSQRLFYGIF